MLQQQSGLFWFIAHLSICRKTDIRISIPNLQLERIQNVIEPRLINALLYSFQLTIFRVALLTMTYDSVLFGDLIDVMGKGSIYLGNNAALLTQAYAGIVFEQRY